LIQPSSERWKEDSQQTLDRMRNVVVDSGARLLELQPPLPPDHYFPEGHFNALGNENFARQMIGFLRETPALLATAASD
jgi:hypothetical protein